MATTAFSRAFLQAQHLGIVGFARARGVDGNVHAHLAVAKHQDAVGEHGGFDHVVGDQHDGEAFPAPEVGQQVLHLDPGQRVQRAERLVQQKQPGPADQRPGQRHPLALTARQHRRPFVGAVGQTDIGERLQRPLPPIRAARDPDIVHDPLPGQQAGVLEQHPHGRGEKELRR